MEPMQSKPTKVSHSPLPLRVTLSFSRTQMPISLWDSSTTMTTVSLAMVFIIPYGQNSLFPLKLMTYPTLPLSRIWQIRVHSPLSMPTMTVTFTHGLSPHLLTMPDITTTTMPWLTTGSSHRVSSWRLARLIASPSTHGHLTLMSA